MSEVPLMSEAKWSVTFSLCLQYCFLDQKKEQLKVELCIKKSELYLLCFYKIYMSFGNLVKICF